MNFALEPIAYRNHPGRNGIESFRRHVVCPLLFLIGESSLGGKQSEIKQLGKQPNSYLNDINHAGLLADRCQQRDLFADRHPDRLSRKEVQDRYGSPVSATTTRMGKQVEIYRLRKRLDTVYSAMANRPWQPRQDSLDSQEAGKSALICLLLGPGCLYVLILVTVNETFSLPVNLVRSQMNQLEVAFVFGNDDRLLYLYGVEADPSVRFSQALHTMQHPLVGEPDSDESAMLTDRVRGYIAEARQRAEDIGHMLTEQDEESLRADLQTAEDVDAGIITKQEAITTRPSRFIATYNP